MEKDKDPSPINDSIDATMEGPRENLIATAIKFLQNPKVRTSSFQQQKSFLERKGLTEEEILIATDRSGVGKDVISAAVPTASSAAPTLLVQAPPPPSTWQKTRDYISTAIVIGGVSYAIYVIYKKYVATIWFGPTKEQKQLDRMTQGLTELQQTMSETLTNIQQTQTLLSKQQDVIQDIAQNYAKSRGPMELDRMQEVQGMTEIKEEIKSLKALLLSSRRFAAAPTTAPVIPSWQLTSSGSQASLNGGEAEVTKLGVDKSNKSEVESKTDDISGDSDVTLQSGSPANHLISSQTNESTVNESSESVAAVCIEQASADQSQQDSQTVQNGSVDSASSD